MNERAKTILDFWFIQSSMEDWFKKDDKYDEKIRLAEIAQKERIQEENRRMKEWEKKFDEEQRLKEEELVRKFYKIGRASCRERV